jgi:hypothetical protein
MSGDADVHAVALPSTQPAARAVDAVDMIIIFGRRWYGRVDEHEGQYLATRFFHIYFVPLIPLESMWVNRDMGRQLYGVPTGIKGRSVLSGYARIWGPIAAVGGAAAIAAGGLFGLPIAIAGAVAGALGWSTRKLRKRHSLRSDFNLLAFGTRCDALDFPEDQAQRLRAVLDQRWAEIGGGLTPLDVAQRGSTDIRQSIVAYGLLRLAARKEPSAKQASEEILRRCAGADVMSVEGGPYRAALPPQT